MPERALSGNHAGTGAARRSYGGCLVLGCCRMVEGAGPGRFERVGGVSGMERGV